jgi:hypothetical protein
MKYLRNKNAPPLAGLVQEFIDTAYDTVKLVADNLNKILEVATAIENGTLDDFLSANDIDTLAKLNAYVLDATLLSAADINTLAKLDLYIQDANIASEAYVDNAVTGLYQFKGAYDAVTNTPDLTTSPNAHEIGDSYQVTVGGTFYGETVEPGDQLTSIVNDPDQLAHWSIVNRNIDTSAFATAAQGAKADTALQPGEAATPAQGVLADTALQPADNISELTNDLNFADDQTPAEIAAGYNTVTPVVSQVDAEAGTSTTAERWTPQRVAQAIAAQSAPGGSYAPAEGWDTVINETGLTYTFLTACLSAVTVGNNAAASTYSVPDSFGVAGNTISLFNRGAGAITIDVPGTDTLLSTENVCQQNQAITVMKISATEWVVIGGSA